jgi:inosine/xanthosine triphosphate pyrophosphatase family protein
MQLKGFGERLLIASHNRGKIDELRALLEPDRPAGDLLGRP